MENCKVGFLWFCLAIFLLFSSAKAENKTDPTDNVNLAPFIAWRSAYFCLQILKESSGGICPPKYVLSEGGWLNLTNSDGAEFCKAGGCAEQTRAALKCIHYVKRDYWFANKATVYHLNKTINDGCTQGFTGTSLYPIKGEKKSASY